MSAGSSPRMRGAPCPSYLGVWLQGIIPAYAGSTNYRPVPQNLSRDHPCVCGEHYLVAGSDELYYGSSPRMRGAQKLPVVRVKKGGIIPAYAGSTRPSPA